MESSYFLTFVVGALLAFLLGGWVAKPLASGLHDIAKAIREYAKVLETTEARALSLERTARAEDEDKDRPTKILDGIARSERMLFLNLALLDKENSQTIYEAVTLGLLWVEYYREYWGGEEWRAGAKGKTIAENLVAAASRANIVLDEIPSVEQKIPEWIDDAERKLFSARARAISGK